MHLFLYLSTHLLKCHLMILTYLPGPCVVVNDVNTARKELLSSLHRKASLIHRIVCARSREALLVSDRGFAFTNYGTESRAAR